MARFRDFLDEDAFQTLVARHATKSLAVAVHYCKTQHAAEDAVQEACLKIIRNRRTYRSGMPFSPWYYQVLRNACLDYLRRNKRRDAALREYETLSTPPTSVAADVAVDAGAALDLLAAIHEKERSVLYFKIICGMSFAEVAEALHITEESAKKRAQRGLKKLRTRHEIQRIRELHFFS
jgi:RNA polymerase sigma-70 factor (ECF subfamily)